MEKGVKWVIGLVVVFVLVGVFLLFKFGVVSQSALGGYQVMSVSQASLVNDGVLGKAWVVTVSTIPSSFSITGRVLASDVSQKVGETPVSDFDIQMSTNQVLKYPISDSGVVIYDYYMTSGNSFTCLAVLGNPSCPVNSGNSALTGFRQKYGGTFSCQDFCVYRVAHGKVGVLQANPSTPTNISIVITANGLTSQVVNLNTDLDSVGNQDIMVNGKTLGRVYYSGDLVNAGQIKPELFQNYKPINKDGVWMFTSYSAYNNYNSLNGVGELSVKNTIDNCLVNRVSVSGFSSSTGVSLMQQCVSSYHTAYSNLNQVTPSGLSEIKVGGASQIFATFNNPSGTLYSFPVLTFMLDTDWVGIKVLKGVPKINSLSTSKDCTSGTHGEVTAVVSNTGNSVGAFDVTLVCNGASVLTSVLTDNWQPAEQKTLSYQFDMNNIQSPTTKSCTLTAKDKASSVYDQKTLSVTCNPTVICTPNTGVCQGDVKMVCNSLGSAFVVASGDTSCVHNQSCKSDTECGFTGNVANHCVSGVCQTGETCTGSFLVPASIGTTNSCNVFCQVGFSKPSQTNTCVKDYKPVIIIVVTIVVLFGMFLIFMFKKNQKGNKKGSGGVIHFWKYKAFWIALAVLVGVSLLIGYFKYFFWTAIILGVLYGVYYFFIKRKM